jgi:hypothetical protein
MERRGKGEESSYKSMKHRVIIVVLGLSIIGAVVGGAVYWEWPAKPSHQEGLPLRDSSTALGPPPAAEAQAGIAVANPTVIAVNEPTDVTVTIQITESRLIASSVNFQRLDSSGQWTVLGTLNDSGTNGDSVPGDKTFTVRRSFTEGTAMPVSLRVSWALKGTLRRDASPTIVLDVWPTLEPEPGLVIPLPVALAQTATTSVTQVSDSTTIDVGTASASGGGVVYQIRVVVYPNSSGGSLADWFTANIDSSGSLITLGVFAPRTLADGKEILERFKPIPTGFQETNGPIVGSLFVRSSSGQTIGVVTQTLENELYLRGYSGANDRASLLRSIAQNMRLP